MGLAGDLRKFGIKSKEKLSKVHRGASLQLGADVTIGTPVRLGTARFNWQPSINNPASGVLDGKDLSGQLAIARLKAELEQVQLGQPFYFVNNLPYIYTLEYGGYGTGPGATDKTNGTGYSIQAPNGMLRINVLRWNGIVRAVARKVANEP